jgi:hypothetical protein
MRFYNQSHAAYCGVDLHARTMYLHILDGVCSWYLGGKSADRVVAYKEMANSIPFRRQGVSTWAA